MRGEKIGEGVGEGEGDGSRGMRGEKIGEGVGEGEGDGSRGMRGEKIGEGVGEGEGDGSTGMRGEKIGEGVGEGVSGGGKTDVGGSTDIVPLSTGKIGSVDVEGAGGVTGSRMLGSKGGGLTDEEGAGGSRMLETGSKGGSLEDGYTTGSLLGVGVGVTRGGSKIGLRTLLRGAGSVLDGVTGSPEGVGVATLDEGEGGSSIGLRTLLTGSTGSAGLGEGEGSLGVTELEGPGSGVAEELGPPRRGSRSGSTMGLRRPEPLLVELSVGEAAAAAAAGVAGGVTEVGSRTVVAPESGSGGSGDGDGDGDGDEGGDCAAGGVRGGSAGRPRRAAHTKGSSDSGG
jgi:hypothetical protein